jgi:hypothetical protein
MAESRWLKKIRESVWNAEAVQKALDAGVDITVTTVTTAPTASHATLTYYDGARISTAKIHVPLSILGPRKKRKKRHKHHKRHFVVFSIDNGP